MMVKPCSLFLQTFATVLLSVHVYGDLKPPGVNPSAFAPTKAIGDCYACKLFIKSFKTGIERTARGKYEGGDAAWEEEKLKTSYRHSEVRLVDIQEGLCKDEKEYSAHCHNIAEKAEDFIEDWWRQNKDDTDNLFSYVCLDKLKVCCPEHHYGADCTPCQNVDGKICNGNGKCRGDGTRKGNGSCLCDSGYTGNQCDKCAKGYFENGTDKKVCSPCHRACLDSCRGSTSRDCVACKPGYKFDTYEGCLDIDECNENPCERNEFCLNSIGSYLCAKCDLACESCHGDGPDMCRKCAKGYSKKDDLCIKDFQPPDADDESHIKLTQARYFTYIGLIIATGIILPSSSGWGAVMGTMAISYILGAEYYCMINGYPQILVNLKDFDLMRTIRTQF